jgi:hypothetical protein
MLRRGKHIKAILTPKLNILLCDGHQCMWRETLEDCHHDILQHNQFNFTWSVQFVFV